MEVRQFEPEDAERLSELIARNFQQVLVQDYPIEAIETWVAVFTPERLIEESRRQFMVVGMVGNELVGLASLDGDRVRNVFVDVARHRTGIGKALMTAVEAHARERHVKTIYLMAAVSARGFYEKLGFRVVKRIDRDLNGIPVPEVRMEKTLAC